MPDIDFSEIDWTETNRVEERQLAVMRAWSEEVYGVPVDAAVWNAWRNLSREDPPNEIAEKLAKVWLSHARVHIAKLWRLINDESNDDVTSRNFLADINDYFCFGSFSSELYPEIRPLLIGTDKETLGPLSDLFGIGGHGYDFPLIAYTRLIYLDQAAGGAFLEDETKRIIIEDLLSLDGSEHHTHIIIRDELIRKIRELLVAATLTSTTIVPLIAPLLRGIFPTKVWDMVLPLLEGALVTGAALAPIAVPVILIWLERYVTDGLEETENHILMSETSRYLKNQLIYGGQYAHLFEGETFSDLERFDNERNGFNRWFKMHLKRFLCNGFNEYNSRPYSHYSAAALANLADYAEDPVVQKSAQIVLDFLSAHFATQSFDLKRNVCWCRTSKAACRDYAGEDYADCRQEFYNLWRDPMAVWYAVLIGNYAGLEENSDGIWQDDWNSDYMILPSSTDFRVPSLILDLAVNKEHNPYLIRVNHCPSGNRFGYDHPHAPNIEIISARGGYLLTAGGRFSRTDYWWRNLLKEHQVEEHHGWARPTALIIRGGHSLVQLIRSDGYDDWHLRNNTGVWRNVAASVTPFQIPEGFVMEEGDNDWQFIREYRNDDEEESIPLGIYVAVNNDWNLLTVVEDHEHGGPRFRDFRYLVQRQRGINGRGSFWSHEGFTVEFDAHAPIGEWPIISIGARSQERNYHRWPFIESMSGEGLNKVLSADGDGKVIVNNPYMGQSLILSLTDWRYPVRLEQNCEATDLTQEVTRFYASSNSENARLAFDNDRATIWRSVGLDDEWLCVDFGEEKTFNFISIRFPQEGRHGFDWIHHGVDYISVETSMDNRDFRLLANREIPQSKIPFLTPKQNAVDIETGGRNARYVRFRFGHEDRERELSDHFEICEIEIFAYVPMHHPSREEPNDSWEQATHIVPGYHNRLSIHQRRDVDFYKIVLLTANFLRATVEYDPVELGGNLEIELQGWPDGDEDGDPVPLDAVRLDERDGDLVRRHLTYQGPAKRSRCFIRISGDGHAVGSYSLITQTRGGPCIEVFPELPCVLVPKPDRPDEIERAISRSGNWIEGVSCEVPGADVDICEVTVPGEYLNANLKFTLEPIDSDYGQPHSTIEPDPERKHHVLEQTYNKGGRQVVIVQPRFKCFEDDVKIRFKICGQYNNGYRSDSGGYKARAELITPAGSARTVTRKMLNHLCWVAKELRDDLIEIHDGNEVLVDKMLVDGISFGFDLKIPRPEDPFILNVISNPTNEIFHNYSTVDKQLFNKSYEDFITAVSFLNDSIETPGFG